MKLATRHPWGALAAVLGLSALSALVLVAPGPLEAACGLPSGRLGIPRLDPRIDTVFPVHDARRAAYAAMRADFGRDDRGALVLIETPDALDPAFLARLEALTLRLAEHDHVDPDGVTSLSHTPYARSEGDLLEVGPLYAPGKPLPPDLLENPLYRNRVVSADGTLAALSVAIAPWHDAPATRRGLVADLRAEVAAFLAPGERAWFDGVLVVREEVLALMRQDLARVFPLAFGVLLLVLGLLLRRVAAVAFGVGVVALSGLWALAFMSVCGLPLTLLSPAAFPVLLLVAGVGDVVHALGGLGRLVEGGVPRAQALDRAQVEAGGPCLMTSLTSAAAFASLWWSDVPLIQTLGLPIAVGVLAAWVVCFASLPALGRLLGPRLVPPLGRGWVGARIGRACFRLARERRGWVLGAFALGGVLCVVGAGRVAIESKVLGDFPPEHPLRRTRDFVEARFGGVTGLQLVIRPREASDPEAPRLLEPDALQAVGRLVAELRAEAAGGSPVLEVVGLTDYLADLMSALDGRGPGTRRLPETSAGAAQLLLLYEGAAPADPTRGVLGPAGGARLEGADARRRHDVQRVTLRLEALPTPEFFALVERLEARAREVLPEDLEVEASGTSVMIQAAHGALIENLATSLLLALGIVLGLILLWTRSPRLTAWALVPNLVPLLALAGAIGALGIELRLATSVVFCLAFGVAVDDTIHLLAALARRRDLDLRARVRAALEHTGSALVGTTAVLVSGFAVLLASGVLANRILGGLCALALLVALAADLLLLPALLLRPAAQGFGATVLKGTLLFFGLSGLALLVIQRFVPDFMQAQALEPRWELLPVALLLLVGLWISDAARYKLALAGYGVSIAWRRGFALMALFHMAAFLTPGASGGQPLLIWYLRRKGIEWGVSTAVAVIKPMSAMAVIGGAALLVLPFRQDLPPAVLDALLLGYTVVGAVLLAIAAVIVWPAAGLRWLRRLTRRLPGSERWGADGGPLERSVQALTALRRPGFLAANLALALVWYGFEVGLLGVLIVGVGATPDDWPHFLTDLVLFKALAISAPTPGASGVAEGGLTVFFGTTYALAIMACYRVAFFYLEIVAGLAILGWEMARGRAR